LKPRLLAVESRRSRRRGVDGDVAVFNPEHHSAGIVDGPLWNAYHGPYALTGEVRNPGRTFFGVGGGFGKVNTNTGLLVEALAGYGLPFLPNTSLVVRFYAGDNPGVGTTGFAGLKINL